MSIPKRMTVNCSKCGKPLSVTVFESVNSDYADNIAMQIITGDLFNVKCPHCKFVSHLEYDVLYHDMRHGAMIWVVHPNSPVYMKKLAEVRTTPKLPYKTFRIVNDMNSLKEKVSCLESGRDDRIIELCKVFSVYNLLSQQPDFDFRNAFYTTVSGKELIYLYDNKNKELSCELPDKAYDYLKDLYYGSHYAAQFDGNYPVVDYTWAENVFIPLMEAEADDATPVQEEDVVEPTNNVSPLTVAPAETAVEETKKDDIPVEAPATPISPIVDDAPNIDDVTPEEAAREQARSQEVLAHDQDNCEFCKKCGADITNDINICHICGEPKGNDFRESPTESKVQKCEKCGKYSVSIHKGVCFECRKVVNGIGYLNNTNKSNSKDDSFPWASLIVRLVIICSIIIASIIFLTRNPDSDLTPVSEPYSGQILSGSRVYGESEITIKASSGDSCVVKLKDRYGNEELSFYVRAGDTVTVDVPADYLYVCFASGDTWYGEDLLFGEDTSYQKVDDLKDFSEYTWEYTLYPVSYGNLNLSQMDGEDF